MKILLIVLALALGNRVWADDVVPPSDWQAACTLNGQPFSVRFHTDSPDVRDNDDMQATLTLPDQRQIKLPVPQAWFHPVTMTSTVRNLCDNIVATPAGGQRVLLWLSPDDRPDYPQLTLLLVDLQNGRVLDKKLRLGAVKCSEDGTHLALRAHGAGNDVRLVREVLVDTNDDTAYNYIEDWMQVTVRGERIATDWLRR